MTDSSKIAPTAHYTAYAWHRLGLPHAELFTTSLGARLHRLFGVIELPERLGGRRSRLLRTLDNRHALIEQALEELRPDVIVEIGAGLSRRGVTWSVEHGVRYVEIDLPEMLAYKQHLIDTRAGATEREAIARNLRMWPYDIMADGFAERLAEQLRDAHRPAVVAEGVIGYFERPLQLELLRGIHGAFAGRGEIIADLRIHDPRNRHATRLLRTAIFVATRGRGAAEGFESTEDVRQLFRAAGFDDVEQLAQRDAGALSGVWRAR